MAEFPQGTDTDRQKHQFSVQHEVMSEDEKANLLAAFQAKQAAKTAPADSIQPRDDLRSVLPPKRPARRWVPSRICRCGGGCRFKPKGVCFGDEPAIQLFITEPWGGV